MSFLGLACLVAGVILFIENPYVNDEIGVTAERYVAYGLSISGGVVTAIGGSALVFPCWSTNTNDPESVEPEEPCERWIGWLMRSFLLVLFITLTIIGAHIGPQDPKSLGGAILGMLFLGCTGAWFMYYGIRWFQQNRPFAGEKGTVKIPQGNVNDLETNGLGILDLVGNDDSSLPKLLESDDSKLCDLLESNDSGHSGTDGSSGTDDTSGADYSTSRTHGYSLLDIGDSRLLDLLEPDSSREAKSRRLMDEDECTPFWIIPLLLIGIFLFHRYRPMRTPFSSKELHQIVIHT